MIKSHSQSSEEEIDDLLWQKASQDYEQSLQASQVCQQSQSPVSLRFASPFSSQELFSTVEESVPEKHVLIPNGPCKSVLLKGVELPLMIFQLA